MVTLVAPPGYGKTTVLAQWSASQVRPVAWVSLDKEDNDPSVLLADAAAAMANAQLIEPTVLEKLRAPATSMFRGLGRITPALASMSTSMALVLDHVETIENPESLDLINELALRLPVGSQLAIATRTLPPLPTALMRSRGDVVEIGLGDLAMNIDEAKLLLDGAGARVDDADVERLVEQTEGWPAGLYLAALALRAGGRAPSEGFDLRGDDRLIGDYLRSEILSHLDAPSVEFLTRTSILDHLCGPLCDAVLDRHGSQTFLESLESSNLLLAPLDRHREWYRYHRLLRDLLAADLRRREPELVPLLHARAASWLATNRLPEPAIRHAQQAGRPEMVAWLVTAHAQPAYAAGRAATVRGWFDWFQTESQIESFPGVAVLGGLVEALSGRPAAAERWQAAAEAGTFDGALPDGSPIEAWRSYLRALLCRNGVVEMRSDARAASETLAPASPLRAGALLLEGLSYVLEDEHDAADPILARAVDVGSYVGAAPATAAALAERAFVAIARRDWDLATQFAQRGTAIVHERDLGEYVEAAAVHIAAACTAIHGGQLDVARDCAARAARLRPLMTYAVPVTAQFQLELARTYLQLGDQSGARTILRELRENLNQRPGLGTLQRDADALHAALDTARHGSIGASTLSIAELRVLPYLPTHLSFRAIGARLYVSHHTVKTQAISIYRKLGVSSRGAAIDRAREIGLLDR